MARKFDIEEFRDHLRIDRHNLDEEVERQPTLYYQIAAEAARLRSVLDAAKEALDRTTAEVDAEIRVKAAKDETKVTEGAIKSQISQHEDYRLASDHFLAVKAELDQVSALQEAFRQRSYMLRDLVELYVSGYYTDAAIKGHSNKAKERHAEKNQEKMAERRRARLREE